MIYKYHKNNMKEEILQIKQNSLESIKKCENLKELAELKVKYLGKKEN